jgi:diguanylate cyclase (GGDEF)-like protein
LTNADSRDGEEQRSYSLRREWTRAFAVSLVFLLVAGMATFAGVRHLVGRFEGTALQLDRETTTVTALQSLMSAHDSIAHLMLAGLPVDRAAFLSQQDDISRRFDSVLRTFPPNNGSQALIRQSRTAWQDAMSAVGLWGDQARTFNAPPASSAEQRAFAVSGDAARLPLDGLETLSFDAMRNGLASGARLQRTFVGALTALLVIAFGGMLYFRRRMAKDLLHPVASLHDGVLKLRAGQLDHRIDVARRDELGELAEAFNGMADALHDSHRALTIKASHDSLTGLANRASLAERLGSSFGPGRDRRGRRESVLFIDIDDFKDVNDALGHEAGDELLVQLADRLSICVRSNDLVARLGGDEFAVIVADDDTGGVAVEIAERVLATLQTPFSVAGVKLAVAASIGVAHRRPTTADAAELLREADFAMYMAKGSGKGRFEIFDAQMHDSMVGRAGLKTDLSGAVPRGELRLDYQPIADLRTGAVVGVEALVRWQHPRLGLLAPIDFIPLAEETGDIDAIGCWVLDSAARQVAVWRHTLSHAELWVSVNLSALQLRLPQSLSAIRAILADPAIEAQAVVLEVTETTLAVDVDDAIAGLRTLKQSGVRIAIDDFGTGFSSLSTLGSLPVDIVKIDRTFVSGQASIAGSAPMLEGILGLAGKLDLMVIAEGIEEPEQLELLRSLGCRMGQGFLLGRPGSAEALEPLMVSSGLLSTVLPIALGNSGS